LYQILQSNDAALTSVSVNGTSVSGPSPYTISIAPHAATVPVTIVAHESHATISVKNSANTVVLTNTGTASGSVALANGANTFTITVTAQNGTTTATYSLVITDAAAAGGDPYVTTCSNISYKLPALNAPIRYFQTREGGKLLTINAALKTIERSAMEEDALKSLIVLRKKMTTKQYIRVIEKLKTPELLCFFEKVSIQYGNQRLVVNLWDSRFDLVENTLRCAADHVDRPDLLTRAGGIYNGYKADTIKLTIGSTAIYLSTYNSPMVRNGIAIESGAMAGANGVIVNALSESAMVLSSLASVEPVARQDSRKAVTKVETFVDHEGLRTRNVVMYQ
jgi:hypothetical protein